MFEVPPVKGIIPKTFHGRTLIKLLVRMKLVPLLSREIASGGSDFVVNLFDFF